MRTVTYGAAVSLDGFIAGPNGEIDWLRWSDDVDEVMRAFWKDVDAVLMGRKTWDFAATQSGEKHSSRVRTYVFSRTLSAIDARGVTLVRDDAADFVRRLKSEPGGRICLMGGGEFARSLFDAGLVDEVRLNIHPVLLGEGIPTFGDRGTRVPLELTECRTIHGGCVLASYRAAR
ncbi:bifunctional deaminase-reductase domain protein [Gemmatirosa kalamazoonensis]|uniref:Bifunctional deaminase-reductase domain protein n=1 Tax=Gemmatirosa kalamazoonensis TaxID=861299 RepID=W0RNH6_9BACT|nr:dihydrofolate reductase family protein [Gemmatirosa kalamazoonensis]AHG91880.1 bifunctional deaminase-reductase domain protein [Gemmatirosa kalamazoonensis]